MENIVFLNNQWKFSEEYEEEMIQPEFEDSKWQEVRIPHTCRETPLNYFDEEIYQMECLYRKTFVPSNEWKGKSVLLTMDGVAHESEVFLNGEKIGEHHCGYTAFTMDISQNLNYEEENVLAVRVDSRENLNIPPFGYVIDYMTYGGIYREVFLEIKNKTHFDEFFLYSEIPELADQTKAVLHTELSICHPQEGMVLCQYIRKKGTDDFTLLTQQNVTGEKCLIKMCGHFDEAILWDTENPQLYEIKTQLIRDMEILDERTDFYGFRKAEFRKDGFYLNGKKLKIRGLNRHQSYPYVGYAMPASMQRTDADILKKELGLNAVRTSHYPQSHDFLNRCDELGLLVFTEIPGWQHIGDEKWQEQAVINTEDMVRQYRNHTSIILWGVRINESQDNDVFYKKTNEVARKLDPTRQTGGVRAHKKSSFLEDVYTYNDFSHNGQNAGCEPKKNVTSDMERAYLISEYNGHMYPTKSYDAEEHCTEHAIRHANVLNAVAGQEDIAGSFGWCMADYNTHKDFGSGDRICYHGVLDMFRNPKMAAGIYACQQEKDIYLSVTSTMDIGEHPECNRGKIWILSNADSVRMYKNDRFIKEYPSNSAEYPNLPHGPVLIDDYIGDAISETENFKPAQAEAIKDALNATARYGLSNLPKRYYVTALKMILLYGMKPTEAVTLYNKYIGDWGGTSTVYRFEAIKDKKVVKTVVKKPMTKVCVEAVSNNCILRETATYDVAAVRIQAKDEYGNRLPFYQEPLTFETEGPIEVIGPKIISLQGGMGGTYVKTLGTEGRAKLYIRNAEGICTELEFQVEIENINER